ncbi:uncharacterized protein LOC136043942 [Artemia franciscana]|uniref:uncharacterized protein LOC136043942 n=1 Tax=Artemia franciscana TaxID=6661 RepID=UPI0032DB6AB5
MRRLILLVLVCDSLCDESEKCGPLFVDRFLITRRCTGRTTVFTSTTTITLLPTVLSTVTTSCYVRAKKDCPQRRRRSTYIEEALHQEQVFPEEIKNIEDTSTKVVYTSETTELSTVVTSCYVKAKKDCPQRNRGSKEVFLHLKKKHMKNLLQDEIKAIEKEVSPTTIEPAPEIEGSQELKEEIGLEGSSRQARFWPTSLWRFLIPLPYIFRFWPTLPPPITLLYIETESLVSTISATSTITTTNSLTIDCNPTFDVQFCP